MAFVLQIPNYKRSTLPIKSTKYSSPYYVSTKFLKNLKGTFDETVTKTYKWHKRQKKRIIQYCETLRFSKYKHPWCTTTTTGSTCRSSRPSSDVTTHPPQPPKLKTACLPLCCWWCDGAGGAVCCCTVISPSIRAPGPPPSTPPCTQVSGQVV